MEKDQELGLYDDWDNTLTDGLEEVPFEVDLISSVNSKPKIETIKHGTFGEPIKPGSLVQKVEESHLPKDTGVVNNTPEMRVIKKMDVRTPKYTILSNKEKNDSTE